MAHQYIELDMTYGERQYGIGYDVDKVVKAIEEGRDFNVLGADGEPLPDNVHPIFQPIIENIVRTRGRI